MGNTEDILASLKIQKQLPVDEVYFIPNHSGNLSAGKVLVTPLSATDVVNKDYVDSATGAGGATTGAGAPAGAPTTLGSFYLDTSNNILYIAMGLGSAADWKAILTE
jgi:hypothetical protein